MSFDLIDSRLWRASQTKTGGIDVAIEMDHLLRGIMHLGLIHMSAMNPDQLLSNLLAEVNTIREEYSGTTLPCVHLHFKIAF